MPIFVKEFEIIKSFVIRNCVISNTLAVTFNSIFIYSSTFNRFEKNPHDMLFKFVKANLLLLTENEDNDV